MKRAYMAVYTIEYESISLTCFLMENTFFTCEFHPTI